MWFESDLKINLISYFIYFLLSKPIWIIYLKKNQIFADCLNKAFIGLLLQWDLLVN